MRIAVLVIVMAEQRAAIAEKFHDNRIRGEDVFAFIFRQTFGVDAAVIDRRSSLETVSLAGVEVVDAVAGRSVNDPATLVERDVSCEHTRNLNRQEGMLEF